MELKIRAIATVATKRYLKREQVARIRFKLEMKREI